MRPKSTPFTRLAASAYELGTKARKLAYDNGLIKSVRIDRPVISVGNITAGGAGKTPLTILLVERLQSMGLRVCVLSRGYGAQEPPKDRPRIVCDGHDILVDAARSGDEPQMIAQKTMASVVIYPSRVEAAQLALDALEPDVFVLDDGFQHWQLERDLNILVMDAREPIGNGELLPAGPLRESPAAIERAHLIAINHGAEVADTLPPEFESWAPHFEVWMKPVEVCDFGADKGQDCEGLKGEKVMLVSAIARAQRFKTTVENLGATVVKHQAYRDHYNISAGELQRDLRFAAQVGATAVLVTEKDAARLEVLCVMPVPIKVLRMSMQVHSNAAVLDSALGRLLGEETA
jgi:tetraacyldisaccharide 4'-kinase